MLEPPRKQLEADKAIRVRLPSRLHLHLHAHKILNGRSVRDTVTAALEAYFASQPQR